MTSVLPHAAIGTAWNFQALLVVETGRQESVMKPIAMLGVLLIVLGVAGLFLSRVTWTETKPVVKVGPLQVNAQEDHTIWIPTAAGIAAVLAGVGLVFAGKKTA